MKNNFLEENRIKKEYTSEVGFKQEEPNFQSNQQDNNNEENEDSESSEFDVDMDRLTLIQVKAIVTKNRIRKEKKASFLSKKRKNPEEIIIYDSSTNKLWNTFCPDYEELNRFIQKCTVKEINIDNIKDNDNNNSKTVFDPFEFMEKNNIKKYSLSFEDDLCRNSKDDEIQFNCHSEIKELKPLLSPRMSAEQFILTPVFKLKDYAHQKKAKEEFIQLGKILNEDILNISQKIWMSDFIKYINKLSIEEVICKDKKLEIVFDLDYTCIFSFINSIKEKEAIFYKERYPEKNIFILDFEYEQKRMFSSIVIRKGLKDFVNYVKDICNFHIRTHGAEPYALKIAEKLQKYLGIKFKIIKPRECNNTNNKLLSDLNDKRINSDNSIIFDDTVIIWKKDLANVIPSKKFIDKECGIYLIKEKERDKSSLDNDVTRFLNTHLNFYYNKIDKIDKFSWKNQIVCTENRCPFYQYKDKNSKAYNCVYSGEYLNSKKLQFIYMKNVIKTIYYLIFQNNVHLFDAIKLIRLNALNGKSFYLKYLNEQQKIILTDIIRVCGGDIYIFDPDDSINLRIKKIFLVCSMENYEKERNGIQEELRKNPYYILINEKYILDSYYFMTDLEDSYKDDEYNPEKCHNM